MTTLKRHTSKETAYKDALRNAGINAVVGHGKGTSWGWLYINIGSGEQYGEHTERENRSHYRCPRCMKIRAITERAERIAQVWGENKYLYPKRLD